MTKTLTLLGVAVCLVGSPANAQDRSGPETAERMTAACKDVASGARPDGGVNVPTTYEAGVCWGAFLTLQRVIGATDTRGKPLFSVCAPENSTRTQLMTIFLRYTENHPEHLNKPFVDTAIASLRQAFPCRSAK